jgi:hypothetical protein
MRYNGVFVESVITNKEGDVWKVKLRSMLASLSILVDAFQ